MNITGVSDPDRVTWQTVEAQQGTPPGGELGKDQFLQLLVAQMSQQDPLNPMDSRESIAQLAQFSALEQMQNLNQQVEALRQAGGLLDGILLQGLPVEARLAHGESVLGTVERVAWTPTDGLMMYIQGRPVAVRDIVELRMLTAEDLESEDPDEESAEG